jgi:hypothetical protein
MAGDADPTTNTDRELLDAARVSELQTVTARHADDTSEHPAGALAAEERDLGESSRGPAVRKETG